MTIDMKAIHDSDRTLVMGVLNITEDSFSDGGLWLDPAKAKAHGEAMMKDGADIIDIGAESTRPGAKRVSEEDEQTRVLGAVDALIPEGAVLSIDTTRASVARMALEHGAQIINDVSGGRLDREVPHVVAEHSESLYIVQHWRGWLAGSAGDVPDADTSVYANGVVDDVYDELMKQVDDLACDANNAGDADDMDEAYGAIDSSDLPEGTAAAKAAALASAQPEPASKRAVISLDSPATDAEQQFRMAIVTLDGIPGNQVEGISPLYHVSQLDGLPDKMAAVIQISTRMGAHDLIEALGNVEASIGEDLDLDLIDMEGVECDEPDCKVPWPTARNHAAVLAPWLDMDPDARLGKDPVSFLLAMAPDAAQVGLLTDNWIIGGTL